MFVNDGSKDSTWEIIKKLALEDEHFKKETRNTRNNMYYCDDCNINYGVQSKGGKG